ncbi:hypothetical protein FACUT_13133 [Fusarium acutatum]|uniref:Uncharacterized protein n=1 Tax=Fusarium acutatum TaxID=78861 RepID=A0A8H4JCB0_9HYPO|nr:hypothetical protein FACUT_13133 [Fusarium acutatum]
MNAGKGDAPNLKAFVEHSDETSHGDGATAEAAKDREMAKNAVPAPYVSNKQSKDRKHQQSHKISGTADAAKGARDHRKQVIDPQKDACQARSQEQPCEEGHEKDLALSDNKITDKTSNSKRRADDTKEPHKKSHASKDFLRQKNTKDTVSPAAQEALKYRVNRSSSSKVQWHEMSKILFGKLGLSLNPYQDGVFKEITGIIRGIWKNEGQNIISSLRETQNVPCADQLRPLLSEILTRVEDCFEQKEQKSSKLSPRERSTSNQSTPRMSPEEGKWDYEDKHASGLNTIENDCRPLETYELHNLPMQDWSYASSLDSSNNILNYTALPEYQNHQFGCPFMNLSAGLLHPADARNWQFMGPNSVTAMENITQASTGDFPFTDYDLLSAQTPNLFD